jgi:hypothetical protein
MLQNPPVTSTPPVTIKVEQVDLLSVTGQLDDLGLARLQRRLDELLDGGARLLLADLSGVAGCDGRLFDLLAGIQYLVGCRGGWLAAGRAGSGGVGRARPGSPARGAAGVPSRTTGQSWRLLSAPRRR